MEAERRPGIASGPAARDACGAVLVESAAALADLIERLRGADVVAVDIEANGMFVYRERLCTIQLAWRAGQDRPLAVGVVDALAVDVAPLGPTLGPGGPVKILHDLTFDARMLLDAGVLLGRARDTSIAARFLGRASTGLAALLRSELGVAHDKSFQRHDWGKRPLEAAEVRYLVDDVVHLIDLDAALAAHTREQDVEDEVAEECAYKLHTALAPRERRPSWTRLCGAAGLDGPGRASLRALSDARERLAAEADVPPFKILGNQQLVEIARARPDAAGLRAILGRATRHAGVWAGVLDEVSAAAGSLAEETTAPSARPSRAAVARRRTVEQALTSWRRNEARARGVDEQVVLPGHCVNDLCDLALATPTPEPEAALLAVPGLGPKRLARYGDGLATVVRRAMKDAMAVPGPPSGAGTAPDQAPRPQGARS